MSNISYISDYIVFKSFKIPKVLAKLDFSDHIGAVKARLGWGRMNYSIEPGLYAIGDPGEDSPVLVTANYKLTFDHLRSKLKDIDAWILVLNTNGINVWCAAGKGTFATNELIRMIEHVNLHDIVKHRKVIVPQLGAVGVSSYDVLEKVGFRVVFGPVRAEDISEFVNAGMKATEGMRRVKFTLYDRIVLIPLEFVLGLRYFILASLLLFLLSGLNLNGYSFDLLKTIGVINVLILMITFLAGTVLAPILLPWLPGRAFSFKGLVLGLILSLLIALYGFYHLTMFSSILSLCSWFFIVPAIISFILMNFTGSSTYTSLSGVKFEMKIAVPLQVVFLSIGIILWIIGLFV